MPKHVVEFDTQVDATPIDVPFMEALAGRALDAESQPTSELSIVLTDDAAIRKLNHEYRGVDAPTDVLSFAQAEGEAFARPDGSAPHIGDVIISIETAARQADEFGVTMEDEVGHLLVHGILHLLGYDHEVDDDARVMREREDAILGAAHHH